MLPAGHDRYDSVDQWQSVHCESRLQCYWLTRPIELFTIFDASFSTTFDFRGFFSGTSSLCLKIDGTHSVPSTSRHGYDVQQSINCHSKINCFSAGISSKQSTLKWSRKASTVSCNFQCALVRWTCLVQKPHKFGSLGKQRSEPLSLGMFPQPAATQRFGMMLLDD